MNLLKKRQYIYKCCPHCSGLNAFVFYPGDKNIVYVCDWCNGEFLEDDGQNEKL